MKNIKILILKNDRVGDLFHALKSIECVIDNFHQAKIEIVLSEYNYGFSKIFNDRIKVSNISYRISTYEKFYLLKKIFKSKYSHILIMSPKRFYYFLPVIFQKIIFSAIVVDNKRLRPTNFIRKKIDYISVNNRLTKNRKHNIASIYKNVVKNLINKKISKIPKVDFIKTFKQIKPNNYIHIHCKEVFFSKYKYSPNDIMNLIFKIEYAFKTKIFITGDLGENAYNDYFKYIKEENIKYFHNIKNQDLCDLINKSDLVVTPHGTISCIAAYFNRPIIDFFEPNINSASYSEFRPVNNNHYKFHIIRFNKEYFNKKVINSIKPIFKR